MLNSLLSIKIQNTYSLNKFEKKKIEFANANEAQDKWF